MSIPERLDGIMSKSRERDAAVAAEQPRDPLLDSTMPELAEHDAAVETALRADRLAEWSSVIDERFAGARLSDVHDGVRADLERWVERPSNLLLVGPVGVGKTHAAAAAAFELWRRGRDVAAYELDVLIDEIDWRSPDAALHVNRCARVPLLVLDDLGATELSSWALGRVSRIGAERWRRALPTVITTNLEPEELEVAVGERLFSRLADEAVAVWVPGHDRRRTRRER